MIVHLTIPVHVTGIGFFDFIHGQTGVAPNGVELHLVRAFRSNVGAATANPHSACHRPPAS